MVREKRQPTRRRIKENGKWPLKITDAIAGWEKKGKKSVYFSGVLGRNDFSGFEPQRLRSRRGTLQREIKFLTNSITSRAMHTATETFLLTEKRTFFVDHSFAKRDQYQKHAF